MPYLPLSPANLTTHNSTAPLTESNTVSWQSAFWPLAACTLAVMLQNTGRVCGAPYKKSYALRTSPVICALDTTLMMVKFVWMLILGCPVRRAARHVWYDRFVKDDSEHPALQTLDEGVLSEAVGGGDSDSLGEQNGKTRRETSIMSKALSAPTIAGAPPIPQDERPDYAEGLSGDGDIANIALGLVADSESRNNGSSPTGTGFHSPKSTNMLAGGDVEAGKTMTNENALPTGVDQCTDIHPGSDIDRAWKLTTVGFIVGVLPQAIKIFGMRGIYRTQIIVGVQVSSFIVPEVFRLIAGTAGVSDLHQMPTVSSAKRVLGTVQENALELASIVSPLWCALLVAPWTYLDMWDGTYYPVQLLLMLDLLLVAPIAAVVLYVGAFALLGDRTLLFLLKKFTLPRVAAWLLALVAIPARHAERICVLGLSYLLAVPITLLPWIYFYELPLLTFRLMTTLATISALALGLGAFTLFRILFVGSLSKYPRALFGLEGTWAEFSTFTFVSLHALALFFSYATGLYSPEGTYKPDWADMLG